MCPLIRQIEASVAKAEEHFVFAVAEAVFVGWFTFEYFVRFSAAPQKWLYVVDKQDTLSLYLSIFITFHSSFPLDSLKPA